VQGRQRRVGHLEGAGCGQRAEVVGYPAFDAQGAGVSPGGIDARGKVRGFRADLANHRKVLWEVFCLVDDG
jgi:hypothetical protein